MQVAPEHSNPTGVAAPVRSSPAKTVLTRLSRANYVLSGVGFGSVVVGLFLVELTNTTIALGLTASVMAGFAGLVLELAGSVPATLRRRFDRTITREIG